MIFFVLLWGCSCTTSTSSPKSSSSDLTNAQNIVEDATPDQQEAPPQEEPPQEVVVEEPPPLTSPDGVIMMDCPEDLPEDMACIPGGSMIRGFTGEHKCEQGENKRYKTEFGPETKIWIQTFLMDKTEVTYEAYQKCRKEKKCDYAHPSYGDFNRPKQPMMGASWYAAKKFCEVQGKRLPTEAEWEKAARGNEGALTPFETDVVSCEEAVIKDKTGRSCGVKKQGGHPEKGRVWEVALKPPGRYGLYDMVGNAEEWVEDWFAPSLVDCGEDCQGTNPKGPCYGQKSCSKYAIRAGKALKMVKGGSWYWPAQDATAWHRRPHVPENKPYHHFGFRCAKDITVSISTEDQQESPE